jgi:phenylpropionate dioxygenase-like ring-hydroxylating dioxygenase large terminal subunit
VSVTGTRSIPWSWYVDPAALQIEQERIFRRFWQYVARTDEIAEPGSFHTTRAGNVPVLLVRDRDDVLRAFVNVCRHRGSIVCKGSGKRETLQCPYHAWTYGLDGRLLAAPRADREGGIEHEELGLVQLQLESWGPFVFVNPDPDAPPLLEFLEDVPEQIAEAGIDVDALRFLSRAETEYEANWKICAENFLECYHCPTAHPSFSAEVDVHPDRYRLEAHPTFGAQFCRAKSSGDTGQFHLLYPNTGINVFPGPPNLSIGPILPAAPGRTERYLDYFFAPDVGEAWLRDFFAFDDQVGREDTALVESVQRGVASGLVEHGVLLTEAEPLLAAFQRWVSKRLQLDA